MQSEHDHRRQERSNQERRCPRSIFAEEGEEYCEIAADDVADRASIDSASVPIIRNVNIGTNTRLTDLGMYLLSFFSTQIRKEVDDVVGLCFVVDDVEHDKQCH